MDVGDAGACGRESRSLVHGVGDEAAAVHEDRVRLAGVDVDDVLAPGGDRLGERVLNVPHEFDRLDARAELAALPQGQREVAEVDRLQGVADRRLAGDARDRAGYCISI